MNETGYIIRLKNDIGEIYYFRGCARGRSDAWCKRIRSAQIYSGESAALKTLNESNKIYKYARDRAQVVKIKITVEEQKEDKNSEMAI